MSCFLLPSHGMPDEVYRFPGQVKSRHRRLPLHIRGPAFSQSLQSSRSERPHIRGNDSIAIHSPPANQNGQNTTYCKLSGGALLSRASMWAFHNRLMSWPLPSDHH